jgi:UDPglucose 6-dehydrogenase
MHLTIIGTGYVGLVSGTCFAELGFDVTCVDVDETKIERLKQGEIPIYEPGLDEMVLANHKTGRLHFTTDTSIAVAQADIVFIAVGTPPRPEDGQADMRYVYGAAEEIAKSLNNYTLIVTKSTVPIGTGKVLEQIVAEHAPSDARFDIASNPEFLREGAAISDFMKPDRVVIGCENAQAREHLEQLYRPLTRQNVPLVSVGRETAEMIKYAANSFLAMKVAFINEMADICEHVGADIEKVAHGIGLDERIGERFLRAGPGFGGSCFPKDTQALLHIAEQLDIAPHLTEAIVTSNDLRKRAMADRIIKALGGKAAARGKAIALLGLTFKPATDDMRAAPSLEIIPALLEAGITVRAYDPEGMEEAKKLLPEEKIVWAKDSSEAMESADVAVILTEWNEFKALDLAKVKALLTQPLLIDLRNIYQPEEMREAGFTYHSIGRPAVGI